MQGAEHWLGQEIKPAPVDQQIKARNALIGIAVHQIDKFGTGKTRVTSTVSSPAAIARPASK